MYLALGGLQRFPEAKIVIAKPLGKITNRLNQNGHEISKSIVHCYLRQTIGDVAFKSYSIFCSLETISYSTMILGHAVDTNRTHTHKHNKLSRILEI